MAVVTYQSQFHTLFNPCKIRVDSFVGAESGAIYVIKGHYTGVIPVPEIFFIFEDSHAIRLHREKLNGVINYDISGILKSFLINEVTPIAGCPCVIDDSLFVEYSIFDEHAQFVVNATAINAVSQRNGSPDLSTKIGHFMTRFDKLKKYNGYPLQVVAFGFTDSNTYINFNGDSFIQIPSNKSNVFVALIDDGKYNLTISSAPNDLFLRDNIGRIITGNLGNGITVVPEPSEDFKQFIIEIENLPTPCNPFYVRWLNRQGGFDYWMFGFRQFLTKGIADKKTYINEDNDEVIYSLSGLESVRVGATNLNRNEFDILSKIIYSPKIEWYDENISAWKQILIEKGDSELDTRSTINTLEFTFSLPNPIIQI